MHELIRIADKEFILSFGDKKLSPIMKLSAYGALKYVFGFYDKTNDDISPLFLSFPDKKNASVWLAISLITNFFNEDYIYKEGEFDLKLKKGRLYSIYGSIGKYIGLKLDKGESKYRFDFYGTEVYCRKGIKSFIKNTNQQRKINSVSHYLKNKRKALKQRNPISKILEPLESINIDDQILTSKIIIISGRGNTKSIHKALNENYIENKSLQKVFSPNSNVIIKPDLKEYKNIFSKSTSLDINNFIEWTNQLIEISHLEHLKERLKELIDQIEQSNSISESTDELFSDIVEEFAEQDTRLLKLKEQYYPGVTSQLPEALKAIVVNDISQIEEYPDTINGFIKNKVPIIFVTNRLAKKRDLTVFNRLFDTETGIYRNAYRINWNPLKIQELLTLQTKGEIYLDIELWEKCKRYARQKININIFPEPEDLELDYALRIIQQKISNLDGFENLKYAFFKYLYPALYAIRNSNKINDSIFELIDRFNSSWQIAESILNDIELQNHINTLIKSLREKIFINSKDIPKANVFSISIPVIDIGQINIPLDRNYNYLPDSEKDEIYFSGFPYKEYTGKYLLNSVMEFFIPEINVQCWPHEGALTYYYLKKLILSGYFTDNIKNILNFPNKFLIKNDDDIKEETDNILEISSDVKMDHDFVEEEKQLLKLDLLQFEGYKVIHVENDTIQYNLKCNILRFNDDSFMFLPYQSKLLGEYEEEEGKTSVKRLFFDELSVGLRIYKIKSDQVNFSEFIPHDKNILQAQADLNIWKTTLLKLLEKFHFLSKLSDYLLEIKQDNSLINSNPTLLNLTRWLNDEDMIAPSKENLKSILIAGIDQKILDDSLEKYVSQITKAYKYIYSIRISLGHRIKRAIANQLKNKNLHEDEFSVKIQTTEVEVISKTVIELQESDIEVEYHNTRKILC